MARININAETREDHDRAIGMVTRFGHVAASDVAGVVIDVQPYEDSSDPMPLGEAIVLALAGIGVTAYEDATEHGS